MGKIKQAISEHTSIKLSLIISVVGLMGWPVYKAIAKIENHEIRIEVSERKYEKIDKVAEDVNIIKGWVLAQPKRK